jgi:hypothetical protein
MRVLMNIKKKIDLLYNYLFLTHGFKFPIKRQDFAISVYKNSKKKKKFSQKFFKIQK